MNIFLIADTHFDHKNIIEYCNRPFDSVEEMNQAIINNWNSTVSEKDLIFHLGDFAFCNADRRRELADRLKGNIVLIKGNHDKATVTHYESLGFAVYDILVIGEYILSHRPVKSNKINIHGHKHNLSLNSNSHFCVSVEQTGYSPMLFNEIKGVIDNE